MFPQAVLGPPQPFELPFEQLRTEADVTAAAAREAAVPFDIGVGPLLRARLFGLGEQRHVSGADDASHRHGRLVIPGVAA